MNKIYLKSRNLFKKSIKEIVSRKVHKHIKKEGIKDISFWFNSKYGKFYSEIELNRILFSIIKTSYPHEAVIIGDKIQLVEKDPLFMKILAKVHKDIGNIAKYKFLLDEITKISPQEHYNEYSLDLDENNKISINKFKRNLLALSDNEEISQQRLQQFLDENSEEFDDKARFNRLVFSILKDSHTSLAINYGLDYYNSQRETIDVGFVRVLLLRLERLMLFEKAKQLAVEMFKNEPSNSFYEDKIVRYISIENSEEILSQDDNIETYTKNFLLTLLGTENLNLNLDLLVYKIIFTIAKDKQEFQKLAEYYANKYFTASEGDDVLRKLLVQAKFNNQNVKKTQKVNKKSRISSYIETLEKLDIRNLFKLVFGGRKYWWLIKKLINKYNLGNTGVNISRYIPIIISLLSKHQVKVANKFFTNDNELDGLLYIYNNVNWQYNKIPVIKKTFARVISIVKHSKFDIKLPDKITLPKRKNSENFKNTLYVVHMRAPIINNGYTRRTSFILKMLHLQKYNPTGVTRLAFPHELSKYRDTKIVTMELVDDTNFYALTDPAGGLNRRALGEYINIYADRLIDIVEKEEIEIIHSASNYLNGMASIIASRKLGIPCIYEVRGLWYLTKLTVDDKYSESIKYAMEERMELQAVNSADKVIVISESLKKYFIDRGISRKKMICVPNSVDTDVFDPKKVDIELATMIEFPKNISVIGYVGSFVEYEGLDILIHATNELKQRGYANFRVLLIGDGAVAENLKKFVNNYKIEDLVHFIGKIPPEEVAPYYSRIDIAPFPRKRYPVTELIPPLKIMEAMAMECAVVHSDLPVLKETSINKKTAIEFEANNIDSLADVLEYLLENPEKAKNMGRKARKWIMDNRSIYRVKKKLQNAYEKI